MDFDNFITSIAGVDSPLEVKVDDHLCDIIDKAYEQYTRGGQGGATITQQGQTFEEWLGRNPIGRWYLKKITKIARANRRKNPFSEDTDSKRPTQHEVRKLLAKHGRETHYLYELDPSKWDEYDLSNWRSIVRKGGRYGNPVHEDNEKQTPKPTPISTANEERTCPICNGYCEIDGKECWKCHGTGTVYKGVTKESMKTKFKFNQLAEQLCESLGDQPIFVHARSAYNKMSRIKNAILTSATTMRLQMEDNSSVDMSLTDNNHNYQLVMNDGQFISARDVARIFGLLEPDQIVSEGSGYSSGFPYRLEAVKNERVVGSKVIRNADDLNNSRHWFSQLDEQGCKFRRRSFAPRSRVTEKVSRKRKRKR